MPTKILIVTGDAGESYETLYAIHRLQKAGYVPVVGAIARRRLHLVMHDFEPGWDTYVERAGYGVEADTALADVDPSEYAAILIIGGRAPEYLRHNRCAVELVRQFAAQQKWLFAICHGMQLLVAAGVVSGRKVTCYEHVRSEAEQAGASWCIAEAVRDGNMVTAQTWQSHPDFYHKVMACLAASAA